MVILKKISSIFIYNHVKECNALHLEQQLCHAIIRTGILVSTFSCLDT